MKYIDQLRDNFKEGYALGYADWDLIEEIKRLHRFEKTGQKLEKMARPMFTI